MAVITHPATLDNEEVANRIKSWFDVRQFETQLLDSNGEYAVKARKSSWWRTVLAADRAIQVNIRTVGQSTQVGVGQGDWTANIVSNATWFFLTGGANLAISGWSFVIQKQLEAHVRQVLDDLGRDA